MIHFKLPLKLIPKKRPKVTKNGTYMPKDYLQQRDYIRAKIRGFKSLGNVPIKMDVLVVFSTPKMLKKNKYSMPVADCDNLAGSIMDACEGILYVNDRQIVDLRVKKMYGEEDVILCSFEKMI